MARVELSELRARLQSLESTTSALRNPENDREVFLQVIKTYYKTNSFLLNSKFLNRNKVSKHFLKNSFVVIFCKHMLMTEIDRMSKEIQKARGDRKNAILYA